MKILILGDSHRKFDGRLEAQFIDENETKELYFDLDKWEDIMKNGVIGEDRIRTIRPEQLSITFDQEHEIERKDADRIYKILEENGWTNEKYLL